MAQTLGVIFILAGLTRAGNLPTICAHCWNLVVTTAFASCA